MTRTRVPHRRGSRGRMAARLFVFAGALAALFVMHGLSVHAASSHEVDAAMSPAVMGISHAGHPADHARGATDAAGSADAHGPGENSSGIAMGGLCLAVLAGAIVGFLLLRLHRALRVVQPLALPFVATRQSGRRDRDPPCMFELSVLRA